MGRGKGATAPLHCSYTLPFILFLYLHPFPRSRPPAPQPVSPLNAGTSCARSKRIIGIHLFNSALLHPLSILLLFKVAPALTDGRPTAPLWLIMYRGSSGGTGGRGREDLGGCLCVGRRGDLRRGRRELFTARLVARPLSVRH